jgi:Cof subfamily protein (haloacid dehalogenase superfamily)
MAFQTPKVQIVFFDIDGTLVSFKTHAISPAVKAAVNQLKHQGIKVVIATGRALCDINNLEDLRFDGFITANGSYCVDSDGNVVAKRRISKESLERLALYMEQKPFPCSFVTDKGNFINYANELILTLTQLVNIQLPPVKPVSEIFAHDIFQLDVFIDTEKETELLTHVLTDCVACRWHPTFADINAKDCSKATGMDHFLSYFGIDREHTMAFGDGGNDIAMLQHAAIGVAMGNAKDHVKDVADFVTTSVDEDGIIYALRHFYLCN